MTIPPWPLLHETELHDACVACLGDGRHCIGPFTDRDGTRRCADHLSREVA